MRGEAQGHPRVCMTFLLRHQQRVDPLYASGRGKQGRDTSLFSRAEEEKRLRRLSASSYTPTTELLLGMMDEGFSCSFLVSGLLLGKLTEADQNLSDLLRDAITHRQAEPLAESYYQSVIPLFREREEYRFQVDQHRSLIEDFSGRRPSILVAPDSVFNRVVTMTAREMGFSAVYTDVFGKNTPGLSPEQQYLADGMPVLIRHCELSDDIAIRFGDVDWNYHPLLPDTYAGWLATFHEGIVHIMVDMEAFGGRFPAESGIFTFLEELPAALSDAGVQSILPGEAVAAASSPEEIPDELLESASVAWPVNMMQCTALEALRTAGRWVPDKTTYRRLTARDHFSYMATTSGSCGTLTDQRTQADAYQYFTEYMKALSRFEEEQINLVRAKSAVRILRCISPDHAFHFCTPYHREGFSAHSLEEFAKLLDVASDACILHHSESQDFENWIRDIVRDDKLATEIHSLKSREEIQKVVDRRVLTLWNRLK